MNTELRIEWTWAFGTLLHLGAGLSRAGGPDALVLQSEPEVAKGVLRESAERVAAWLDCAQEPPADDVGGGTAGATPDQPGADARLPRHPVFATLFDEYSHYSQLHWQTAPGPPAVFRQTSIVAETGAAREDTLRQVEVSSASNARASGHAHCIVTDEALTDAAETLLAGALLGVEHIGAKRGADWGRVRVVPGSVRLHRAGRLQSLEAALSQRRVETLRSALANRGAVDGDRVGPKPGARVETETVREEPGRWFELGIELKEPACFPAVPVSGNHAPTERFVPATSLRGALARCWRLAGETEAHIGRWLDEATRWSPGFPLTEGGMTVPAPSSYFRGKSAGDDLTEVADALKEEELPRDSLGQSPKAKPLTGAWIGYQGGRLHFSDVRTATRMHIAKDYVTGANLQGALFSRETIEPARRAGPDEPEAPAGSRFVAYCFVPANAFKQERREIALGKRKSAANGLAVLRAKPLDGWPVLSSAGRSGDRNRVFVHLISPAIARGKAGWHQRGVGTAELMDMLAPSVSAGARETLWPKLKAALIPAPEYGAPPASRQRSSLVQSGSGRRGGWMQQWNHHRAAVTVLQQGAVWKLQFATQADADAAREALRPLCQIGERQHEGFGWVAIDPPWIAGKAPVDTPLALANDLAPAPTVAWDRIPEPTPWPGAEAAGGSPVDPEPLLRFQTVRVCETGDEAKAKAVLRRLLQEARDAKDVASVRRYAKRRSDRGQPGVWSCVAAGSPLGEALVPYWSDGANIANLRLALKALAIRVERDLQRQALALDAEAGA